MDPIISIRNLNKVYAGEFQALRDINLNLFAGEIFALLGPNGAGKTSLINVICGIANPTSGEVKIAGFDNVLQYRQARDLIGLVPQELTTDAFETVWDTVSFSRGLFGKAKNPSLIEKLLKDLSLWEKRNNRLMTLSGGMKRRVMIAKALSHEPRILFLDEPSAGVDVSLRKDMWNQVRRLRESGVTIILTTHYIEEAEEMADRIGIINRSQIVLVENKSELMLKLGKKILSLHLETPLTHLPKGLSPFQLKLENEGQILHYIYDTSKSNEMICDFLERLRSENIRYNDISTKQSSLEEIFVELVGNS